MNDKLERANNDTARILGIVVTYNGEAYIEDCLNSLEHQMFPIDILVVDNDSKDNTREMIEKYFPHVKVINIGYNSGFAHANNVGMQYAIERNYDYVLLINEDIHAEKELVYVLMKYADTNTAVIPKIYSDPFYKSVWYGAGKIDFKTCMASNVQRECIDKCVRVNFMTGCCMLLHTNIIKKIGYFDESFFMYYEDTDLSLRMYENDVNMLYVPYTHIWHRVQNRKDKQYKIYYMTRNRLLWIKKHRKCFKKGCIMLALLEIKRILFEPTINDTIWKKYKIKGICDFFKGKKGIV